jgi:hypothetical protein
VFPPHIAKALQQGRKVDPESHEVVTIFFSDIVGFTDISSTLEPIEVSHMLDRLYSKFDDLSRKYDVFKVETIGDAYMAVTNLVKDQPRDHAERIAKFSIDAIQAANETLVDIDDESKGYVNIRVGFHSGPVVSNVVGSRNPRYCKQIDIYIFLVSVPSTNELRCFLNPHRSLWRYCQYCSEDGKQFHQESYSVFGECGRYFTGTISLDTNYISWPNYSERKGRNAYLLD